MRRILAGKIVSNRIPCRNRPFCSTSENSKPISANGSGAGNSNNACPPPSSSNYNDQYKALEKLDFTTAAKILFSDPPKKKKFGLDFHLVQLFFACLPSLAVYLVAQYARSEMRKMDAELERKKQAEFEALAKEMELKAAEEKVDATSNPALLEVKERLDKLEQTVKEMAVESKKQSNDTAKTGRKDANKGEHASDQNENQSTSKTLKEGTVSSEGKKSGLAAADCDSQ